MALLGMLGSGTFTDDERPRNWLQGINLVFPNGDTPLTAVLSMMPEQRTNDPEFRWFEKGMPVQEDYIRGATDTTPPAVDDEDLGSGVGADGSAISLRVNDTSRFTPGMVLMNKTTRELYYVIRIETAGAPGNLEVTRDHGGKFGTNPAITGVASGVGADKLVIVGDGSPEGATSKSAKQFQPYRHYNFTEIFRSSYEITRTAMRTALRTDPDGPMTEAQRDAFQQHSLILERALLYGERGEATSLAGTPDAQQATVSAGKPIRTTRGIYSWLPAASTSASTPAVNWDIGTANAGLLTEDIVDAWCEELFRYGSSEKLILCGGTFLNNFNKLAKTRFTINAVPTDKTYGMAMTHYLTNFGDLYLKQHPLMSHDDVFRRDAFALDMAFIELVVLDDTEHHESIQPNDQDGVKGEFITELGLRVFFSGAVPATAGGLPGTAGPAAHGYLQGVTGFSG